MDALGTMEAAFEVEAQTLPLVTQPFLLPPELRVGSCQPAAAPGQ